MNYVSYAEDHVNEARMSEEKVTDETRRLFLLSESNLEFSNSGARGQAIIRQP